MAKNREIVIFLDCVTGLTSKNIKHFGLGSSQLRNYILTDFDILAKIFKINNLYNLGKKTLLGKKKPKKDSVFKRKKKVTFVHQKSLMSIKCHFCRKKVTPVYVAYAFYRELKLKLKKTLLCLKSHF